MLFVAGWVRESQLMWNTSGMTSKIGECAGEAGEHGKWMDTMLPFIKRLEYGKERFCSSLFFVNGVF